MPGGRAFGPGDHGGIGGWLTDPEETTRDATGLVRAVLRGDDEGQDAILANADLRSLAQLLAATVAAMLTASVRGGQEDPDTAPGPLTEEELQAAEAILATGIEGPGDELGP
jgi:hypothetical protein